MLPVRTPPAFIPPPASFAIPAVQAAGVVGQSSLGAHWQSIPQHLCWRQGLRLLASASSNWRSFSHSAGDTRTAKPQLGMSHSLLRESRSSGLGRALAKAVSTTSGPAGRSPTGRHSAIQTILRRFTAKTSFSSDTRRRLQTSVSTSRPQRKQRGYGGGPLWRQTGTL